MKKIIITVLSMCFLSFLTPFSFSQVQFFDSVKTVVSSASYDYKNPVFSNKAASIGNFSWLVYERHSGSSSDIVIRKARYSSYDSEIVITNTANALNINPTIDNGIVVWQSNVRGNWDLYYSVQINDNNWSVPVLMDSSSSDETNPYIHNNKLGPDQFNYYYLAYKRNNSIRFKKYKTTSGIWNNDTLVTDGTYEDITPVISKGTTSTQFGIVFLRKNSSAVSKLNQRFFYENYTNTPVTWDNVSEIYQPNSQNNLSVSFASSEFIIYSYDTLNSTHMLGFNLGYPQFKEVITKNVPGKHLSGKGSTMGLITDNVYYYFSAFSVLSRYSDSLCFTFINQPASFNENPFYKKLYFGDTNSVTRFDVSQPIFLSNYYRIKTIWEKISGGRTELVESYMTDFLNGVINNSFEPDRFYLAQNFPNPFNPSTVIRYSLNENYFVTLKVFDALGKEVASIVNEKQNAGNYSVTFEAGNLPNGVYFYRLETGDRKESRRMLLIK